MVFLDNASTTPVSKEVNDIVSKYNTELYFNPSAIYKYSTDISEQIQKSKQDILKALKASNDDNFIFTSSATESNNTALFGSLNKKFKKVLISMSEHSSIFACINKIKELGFVVDTINLLPNGKVDEKDLLSKLTDDVGLVSIMHVSNEMGAINDIKHLCELVKSKCPNAIFHSDGVQAFGKIDVNLTNLGVDLYTISGHKVHAPKGIAGLFIKKGIILKPYIIGGGQQENLRSGTENVSGIMALTYIANHLEIEKNFQYITSFKNAFLSQIEKNNNVIINSDNNCSPYILSISFKGVKGETLVHLMEEKGFLISMGSACSSKKIGNRVLTCIGIKQEYTLGSVRISFGTQNKVEEVIEAGKTLMDAYNHLNIIVNGRK
jgi:cysteine desulfurase